MLDMSAYLMLLRTCQSGVVMSLYAGDTARRLLHGPSFAGRRALVEYSGPFAAHSEFNASSCTRVEAASAPAHNLPLQTESPWPALIVRLRLEMLRPAEYPGRSRLIHLACSL